MDALVRFRRAIGLLICVVLVGVMGYMGIERWSFVDSLYMAVHTVTTVGMGEPRPLSELGRLFTVGLIVAGVTSGALMAGAFAEAVVGEQLRSALGRRRMERDLANLKNHYILCGWGRMGQEIAQEFLDRRVSFVVVEIADAKCRLLAERGLLFVQGDASDDEVLRHAGVERARGLVSVAPKDADNVFITLSARSLNPALYIVARSVYEQDVHKLERAGADRVISPYVIGARRIAAAMFHPTVVDFLDLRVNQESTEWVLDDVRVTPRAVFAGKTLKESGIRERTGCTVLTICEGATKRFNSNPAVDTLLRVGDTLIVLGTPDQVSRLEELSGLTDEERHSRPTVALRSE